VVIADTKTLDTLSERELSAGLAEVIKYGLIKDAEFFGWLENNMVRLATRETSALAYAIHRSCEVKSIIVAADERESGERALLNLGHTFGHAIESGMGYGVWLHGEGVAAGMVLAADLSQRSGWLNSADVARTKALLQAAHLPVDAPNLGVEKYLDLMGLDKKVADGVIRLILLKAIGKAVFTADYSPQLLRETLASIHD
jgi:3-dehydroquinate synthase